MIISYSWDVPNAALSRELVITMQFECVADWLKRCSSKANIIQRLTFQLSRDRERGGGKSRLNKPHDSTGGKGYRAFDIRILRHPSRTSINLPHVKNASFKR